MPELNRELDWPVGADDPKMGQRLAEIRRIGVAAKAAALRGDKVDRATAETLVNHLQKEASDLFEKTLDQLAEYKAAFEILSRFNIALMQHAGLKEGDAIDLPKAALDAVPAAAQVACQPHAGKVYLRYQLPGSELGKVDLRAKEG